MSRSVYRISNIAYNLLKKLQILTPPVDVSKIAKALGMIITPHEFGDDISGVLAIKNGKPTIGININHGNFRKRFTIAHEIGHYVLKHERNGLFVDDHKKHFSGKVLMRSADSSTGEIGQEREANAFAAALLMPEFMIKEEVRKIFDDKDNIMDLSYDEKESNEGHLIGDLANIFKVSQQAMSFRFLNLKIN